MGDVVDGPDDPDACTALLRSHGVATVRGNHDRWVLDGVLRDLPDAHALDALAPETVGYLRSLPGSLEIELAGGPDILVCHGLLDNEHEQDHGRRLRLRA